MGLNKFEQFLDRRHNRDLSVHEIETMKGYINTFHNEGPDFDNFKDIYPSEELARDQNEIERLKKLFAQEKTEQHFYAQVLEIILMEFSNSWIPGYLSKASEYDDIKRKTDLILETETEESAVVRIGLDVTSSETGAAEKINELKNDIERGAIGQSLKYFASEIDNTKGPINVPRLVIGAAREEIVELSRSYLHYKNSRPEDRPAIRQLIENHPMGQQLLDELLVQLRAFSVRIEAHPNLNGNDLLVLTQIKQLKKEFNRYQSEKEKARQGNEAEASPNRVLDSIVATLG